MLVRYDLLRDNFIPYSQYCVPLFSFQNSAPKEVSFGMSVNKPFKNTIAIALLGVIIHSGSKIIQAYKDIGFNAPEIAQKSGWESNVRVLASNGQNVYGMTDSKNSYINSLANKLEQKDIVSLEQANDKLAESGYRVLFKFYHPLETPGTKLNIFNKKEINKNRFVLAMSYQDEPASPPFTKVSRRFVERIKKIYNIPEMNIIQSVVNSEDDFRLNINEIADKINALKDKTNVELLVTYTGHGDANESKPGSKLLEGEMEGTLEFNPSKLRPVIEEKDVKKLFREKFKGINTLFLGDFCKSGAFIADNSQGIIKGFHKLA